MIAKGPVIHLCYTGNDRVTQSAGKDQIRMDFKISDIVVHEKRFPVFQLNIEGDLIHEGVIRFWGGQIFSSSTYRFLYDMV